MKIILTTIAISFSFLIVEQSTLAFPPPYGGPTFGSPNRPTVTPYLNLVPGRNRSAALNYYRSYRPEIEFRANEQSLGRSIRSLQTEFDRSRVSEQTENSRLGTTGHSTAFGNTGSYFPGSPQRRR